MFTKKQLSYLKNTDFLLTKHEILNSIILHFSQININLQKVAIPKSIAVYNKNLNFVNGKITKGENYMGLPYIVLDYPFLFLPNNIFTFRTMFWWGNFYTCTLHISGLACLFFSKNILKNINLFKNWKILIGNDMWIHDINKECFIPINEINATVFEQQVKTHQFIKISCKLPLNNYNELPLFVTNCYLTIISALLNENDK